jgi:ABC-2 type transport system permease protein
VALSLWFSALNVRYRDVGHLLNIGLLVWFWATPIVYASFQVERLARDADVLGAGLVPVYLLNPLTGVVIGFQRAIYAVVRPGTGAEPVMFTESLGWYAAILVAVLAASTIVLLLAWRYFFNRSGDFAEEL